MGEINEPEEIAVMHPDPLARRMLHAFAAMVDAANGKVTRARIAGYDAPALAKGTISNHRFDLFGEWKEPRAFNMRPGWFVAEVVPDPKVITERQVRRWNLLEAHARQASQPIYYLVPGVRQQKRLEAVLDTKAIGYTRVIIVEAV